MLVDGGQICGWIAEGYDSLPMTRIFPPTGSSVNKLTVSSPTKLPAIVDHDQIVEPYSIR